MFKNPSLTTRIAVGKLIGLMIGLLGFLMLPLIYPESSLMMRFGFLLWYITFGAIIGIFGIFTYHPIVKISLPWWLRSMLLGSWLNFVLALFIYNKLEMIMMSFMGPNGLGSVEIWFISIFEEIFSDFSNKS